MTVAKRVATAGFAWLVMSSSAAAHPGHGRAGGDFSPLHYLSEPLHLAMAIPMLWLLGWGVWSLTGALRARARGRS